MSDEKVRNYTAYVKIFTGVLLALLLAYALLTNNPNTDALLRVLLLLLVGNQGGQGLVQAYRNSNSSG